MCVRDRHALLSWVFSSRDRLLPSWKKAWAALEREMAEAVAPKGVTWQEKRPGLGLEDLRMARERLRRKV